MNIFKKALSLLVLFFILVQCDFCPDHSNENDYLCENVIDCIEWIEIPAGEYIGGEKGMTMSIDYDYQIMKHEITNEQYLFFLNQAYSAGDLKVLYGQVFGYYEGDEFYPEGDEYIYVFTKEFEDYFSIKFENSKFTIDSSLLNHPVANVSWYGAHAFCNYFNFVLPSNEEWEKAAVGMSGWRFPWGNSEELNRSNIWDSGDPFDNGTTPVGFYNGEVNLGYSTKDDSSPYGLHDLIGNVKEWTRALDIDTRIRARKGMCWLANWYPECWIYFSSNSHNAGDPGQGFRCVKIGG